MHKKYLVVVVKCRPPLRSRKRFIHGVNSLTFTLKPISTGGISSVKEAVKGVKRRASSSVLLSARSSPQQGKEFVTTIPLVDKSDEAEVDISQFTHEDLERLRVEDPFLYFSIPGNKERLYDSDKTVRSNTNTRGARRSSCPELGNDDISGGAPVQRRGSVTRVRRLSVEPHPSVVMKNIMDQMIDDEFDGDTEEEDELIQAIANTNLITDMQEK